MEVRRPRIGRGFRRGLLGAIAAAMLLAPTQAAADPGDTFAEAKPLTPGFANFGPISPNGTPPVWHVYNSGATPPLSRGSIPLRSNS